jgi:hypothetical protein
VNSELWIVSKLKKVLYFLKLFLTLFDFKVLVNLSVPLGLQKARIFFIMSKVLLILNSELSTDEFLPLGLIIIIMLIVKIYVKSLGQEKVLFSCVCDNYNIDQDLFYRYR